MSKQITIGFFLLAWLLSPAQADDVVKERLREWEDKSGHYSVVASLIARNETSVVLETEDRKRLISIEIDKLSDKDRKHLETMHDEHVDSVHEMQAWHLANGLTIQGAVTEYGRRKVTIQRRRGRVYVNDKRFDNLPKVYQKMVPSIVARIEQVEFSDADGFTDWVIGLKGKPKTYSVDGVILELESGDLYAVPFFYFAEEDRRLLEPGWEAWLAIKNDEQKQQQSLNLRAESVANRRERTSAATIQREQLRVAQLQLQLEGYDAGLFDLWEVRLIPTNGRGSWQHVVIPGRTSAQAQTAAMAKYPGYRAVGVAKVQRRR